MEQLTAMEQLIEWIDSDCSPMDCIMKAKELLKVQKEQIITAHLNGQAEFDKEEYRLKVIINAEDYYNETYGK